MILRNLQLNVSDRQELKSKIFASNRKNLRSSLTLNKISTRHEEPDERVYGGERRHSPSPAGRGGLNCDFLLDPCRQNNSSSPIGEARIEELTIERCRLDLEGARVLGKALRTSNSDASAISTLKSLKMVNLAFWDEDNDACEILLPLLEGMAEAGKRGGCLESLEFRRIAVPYSKKLRSRFFSALGQCKNLKSLRLADCDIRSEDVWELAETLRSLCGTLESLDLSRNHIDGAGLEILLQEGLSGHKSLKRLIFSHNPISDDGANHLSKFFSRSLRHTVKTTRIESLYLVDCDLWSPGCAILARGLKDFDTLNELVVGGEWEHHLESIANALKTNVALKHLYMASQACQECDNFEPHHVSAMESIEYYLALNRAHRKISIDEHLSFKLWPTILGRKPTTPKADKQPGMGPCCGSDRINADLWYHLLRRRPELVATDWK